MLIELLTVVEAFVEVFEEPALQGWFLHIWGSRLPIKPNKLNSKFPSIAKNHQIRTQKSLFNFVVFLCKKIRVLWSQSKI